MSLVNVQVSAYGFFELMSYHGFVFLIYIQSVLLSVTNALCSYVVLFLESVLYMTSIL